MRVDCNLFNINQIPTNVGGQGGKENIFAAFFAAGNGLMHLYTIGNIQTQIKPLESS
jgi:hypothetical protein